MTTPDFTNAAGNVFLDGQEEPRLRVVGFLHRHPCEKHGPHVQGTPISLGEPYVCDCDGTALIGWRDWWPLPDEPSTSLPIDPDEAAP